MMQVRPFLKESLRGVKMAQGRLTAKFWVGFYEKFPRLKKGCLHDLLVPV